MSEDVFSETNIIKFDEEDPELVELVESKAKPTVIVSTVASIPTKDDVRRDDTKMDIDSSHNKYEALVKHHSDRIAKLKKVFTKNQPLTISNVNPADLSTYLLYVYQRLIDPNIRSNKTKMMLMVAGINVSLMDIIKKIINPDNGISNGIDILLAHVAQIEENYKKAYVNKHKK